MKINNKKKIYLVLSVIVILILIILAILLLFDFNKFENAEEYKNKMENLRLCYVV